MLLALTIRRSEVAQRGKRETQVSETGCVWRFGFGAGEGEDADAVVLVVVVEEADEGVFPNDGGAEEGFVISFHGLEMLRWGLEDDVGETVWVHDVGGWVSWAIVCESRHACFDSFETCEGSVRFRAFGLPGQGRVERWLRR